MIGSYTHRAKLQQASASGVVKQWLCTGCRSSAVLCELGIRVSLRCLVLLNSYATVWGLFQL